MQHSAFLLLSLFLFTAAPLQASTYFENCAALTGNSATLIVPAAALANSEINLDTGSELALFTPAGTCAGHATWEGGSLALAIWKDDPQTDDQDGFIDGEPLRLTIWDPASGSEYTDVVATLDPTYADEPVFASDAVYLISALYSSTSTDPNEPALAFGLEPNFPNPFVDETTIRYALEEAAEVQLTVYNLLGQRVAELVNERQQPGRYELAFRPPPTLASGAYLYRLVTGSQTAFKRMMLVR